jgi:aspartate racemase
MTEKIIGIMGGQGPEATLDLFRRIIEKTAAKTDQEHFHILIDCNPKVPNPNDAVITGETDPTPMLCANAVNLQKAGADFIVIPCNTVHIFLDAIRASIDIPVMSIVTATVNAVKALPNVSKVGLLASPAVVKTGLYAKALLEQGIDTLTPDEKGEADIHDVIFGVKAGNKSQSQREKLFNVCNQLVANGAQALILGCTELPLLANPSDFAVPAVDTLEVLAQTAIETARSD